MDPWKILIVDDEQDVHEVTEMALTRFSFDERPLHYLHAFSSDEARGQLQQHPDIAIILLDVVMETDDAGLKLVQYIREKINNHIVRIILRTGQPGYAPEKEVITNYDINDYKSKTELTAQKLFTTIMASLRAYKSEHALLEEKDKIRLTLESISDGVISTDSIGRVNYMNDAAEYISGIELEEAFNNPFDCICKLLDPATKKPIENPVITALRTKENIEMGNRIILQRNDGEKRIVGGSVVLTRDHHGNVTGTVLTFHDETLSRNMEKMLDWQQSHDQLTGLINRQQFETHISRLLDLSDLSDDKTFLLYLDINNFKIINDSCGHIAGDKLLIEITKELSGMISEPDILARVGSDEFGILLTQHQTDNEAIEFANNILQRIEDYRFNWSDQDHKISASIGMVPVNSECEGISCVLGAANIACQAAKENQGNSVNFFNEQNSDLLQKMHELSWANKLNHGVQHGNFELWCQRILSMDDSKPSLPHYEILVRMKDNDQLVSPGTFIPAAEKYNLMARIDRWIIEATLKTLSQWRHESGKATDIFCSINLSGASLSDENLIDFIKASFKRFSTPAELICFEVTETATIAHLGKASSLIHEIKKLGCKFSLDDFGSGLSSFSYLRQLPVDYLKIDGQFIRDIHTDSVNYAMVNTINHIGKIMKIETVAEYAENEEIMQRLREIGVDYAQGYAISKPEPFERMLREIQVPR